jgi:DNA repair protein RadC
MNDFKTSLLNGDFVPKVNEVLHQEKIENCEIFRNIMSPIIQTHSDVEKFYTLYLNAKNGLLLLEPSFNGSLTSCQVYPREIIKKALDTGAAALTFAHNHPSGDLKPSKSDFEITKKLMFAAHVFGITVHDHMILNPYDYYSMAEDGIIRKFSNEIQLNDWN